MKSHYILHFVHGRTTAIVVEGKAGMPGVGAAVHVHQPQRRCLGLCALYNAEDSVHGREFCQFPLSLVVHGPWLFWFSKHFSLLLPSSLLSFSSSPPSYHSVGCTGSVSICRSVTAISVVALFLPACFVHSLLPREAIILTFCGTILVLVRAIRVIQTPISSQGTPTGASICWATTARS